MHAIQYVAYETAFGWSFQLIVDLCVAAMNRIILCNIIRLCLFKKPALFTWDCGIFLLLSKRFCFILFMTRLQKAQYMRLKMNRSDVHTNIVYQHIRIEKEKKRKFQTDTNKLFVYLHTCLDVAAIRLLNVNNFEVNYLQLSIVYCKKSESTSILRLSIHRMLIWFDKKTDKWSRFNKFKVLEILGYSSSAVSTNRTCVEWFYCVKYDIIDVSIQTDFTIPFDTNKTHLKLLHKCWELPRVLSTRILGLVIVVVIIIFFRTFQLFFFFS